VDHLSDTHTLLLNKFNVVPHHVLVVTRQFESQQDPLNSNDLAATQQVNRLS
jgi:ATP adenylyltransferase